MDVKFIGKTDVLSAIDSKDRPLVVDLKRTSKQSCKEFIRQANQLKYDMQGAMYLHGFKDMAKMECDFAWLVIGEDWAEVIHIDEKELRIAHREYEYWATMLINEINMGIYEDEIIPIDERLFKREAWRGDFI